MILCMGLPLDTTITGRWLYSFILHDDIINVLQPMDGRYFMLALIMLTLTICHLTII